MMNAFEESCEGLYCPFPDHSQLTTVETSTSEGQLGLRGLETKLGWRLDMDMLNMELSGRKKRGR